MHLQFQIEMAPRGQGRAKATSIGGQARMYKAKADVQHERTLAALCAPFRPRDEQGNVVLIDGPVRLDLVAVLPRPQSLCKVSSRTGLPLVSAERRWHIGKPDADNIIKAVMDGLVQFWTDDRIVCELHVTKRIAAFGESPHYEVQIASLEGA